jgi:hypothetical protein
MSPVIVQVIIFTVIGFAFGCFLRSNILQNKIKSLINKFKKTKINETSKKTKNSKKTKK